MFKKKTKWVDVLTFSFDNDAYLLQGRKEVKSGKAEFKIIKANWGNSITLEQRLKETGMFFKN